MSREEKPQSVLYGRRVIVIEDEPLVAMDLESILRPAGCEIVGSAATPDKAKQIVSELHGDAAIVDLNFPGINFVGIRRMNLQPP